MSESAVDRHDQDRTIDLLKFDYQVARSLIDKFENHVFIVRNWAITTTGAIVAISLSADQRLILVVGLVPPIFFGLLELIYQCWTWEAVEYSRDIEVRLHQVAIENRGLDDDYQFGVRRWIHRPGLGRMVQMFFRRREIPTFYVGLLLVPVVGVLSYPQ
jgi:hypothetical protein